MKIAQNESCNCYQPMVFHFLSKTGDSIYI